MIRLKPRKATHILIMNYSSHMYLNKLRNVHSFVSIQHVHTVLKTCQCMYRNANRLKQKVSCYNYFHLNRYKNTYWVYIVCMLYICQWNLNYSNFRTR